MIDIQAISTGLTLGKDGIWHCSGTEDVSYPEDGNEACYTVEDSSFWFKHRNNCIISAVKTYPPENSGTIFDIGGGNGFVSLGLVNAGLDVALVEPGSTGSLQAKSRGIKNVIRATTNSANFKPYSLPAVGLFDVIEHIDDDLSFLKSISGLIQEDGYLYATVPAYTSLWSQEDVIAGHCRRYSLKSISDVLQAAGFQIVFSSYIFRFLPLPIFLLRTLPFMLGFSKDKGAGANITRDHAADGGIAGKLLDSILQREIKNLNQGASMKFGGSCLIVAKRSPYEPSKTG